MAFKDTIDELQRIDQEDFKRIGTAPVALRVLLVAAACAATLGAVYHFMIKPQFLELEVGGAQGDPAARHLRRRAVEGRQPHGPTSSSWPR